MTLLISLFLTLANAKEACPWNPQPLSGIELEADAREKVLADLKKTAEFGALKSIFDFKVDTRAFALDLNNDGTEEIILLNEVGAEKIRHSLVLVKKGEKLRYAPDIPFPYTYNADPRFVSTCGKNYVATEDGYWQIDHAKLTRYCGADWLATARQEIKDKEDAADFVTALSLGMHALDFCRAHIPYVTHLEWQNQLALDALKAARPALCADILIGAKAAHEFSKADAKMRTMLASTLKLCAPPVLKIKPLVVAKPPPPVAPFPDMSKLFKNGDDDTEAMIAAREQAIRLEVIKQATPNVRLRYPGHGEKSFVKWLDANAKIDNDFDTKAGRYVMWRGASNKTGEEAALVWADAQAHQSAVAVSLGLGLCFVGSRSVTSKALPGDLLVKLHDVCSEATAVTFYDAEGTPSDLLAVVKAATGK